MWGCGKRPACSPEALDAGSGWRWANVRGPGGRRKAELGFDREALCPDWSVGTSSAANYLHGKEWELWGAVSGLVLGKEGRHLWVTSRGWGWILCQKLFFRMWRDDWISWSPGKTQHCRFSTTPSVVGADIVPMLGMTHLSSREVNYFPWVHSYQVTRWNLHPGLPDSGVHDQSNIAWSRL